MYFTQLSWEAAIFTFPPLYVGSSWMKNSHSLGTKEHHDPRIGDEDALTPKSDPPDRVQQPTPMSSPVRPAPEQESKLDCGKAKAEAITANIFQHATSSHFELPSCLRWIPDNWTLSKWMTAIRCAVAEWASLLLLIINPSTKAMGQVRLICRELELLFMAQQRLHFWFWSVRRLCIS
jgi:hypothetical protein